MHEFALIFRPTRAVEPEALARRNAAAREWALAQQRAGTLRTASPLDTGGVLVADGRVEPAPRDPAVAAVLVIAAESLDAAVALAKQHPGLPFGTEIEVRPVKLTRP